jgi:NAD(P)-dependent dehydrogenase (short-subunit alcohol dehydrogenase family)
VTRRAFVTGAAGGIGRAIAERLVKDGYDVVIADVNHDRAVSTAGEIGAQAVVLDVTDAEQVAARAAEFDELDLLVNNAGVVRAGNLPDVTVEDYRFVMDVNVLGPLLTTQAFSDALAAGNGGGIVNIASMSAGTPVLGTGIYPATKAAVVSFTECCAVELGPRGIRVNAVAPGRVSTDMTQLGDPAREARTAKLIPVQRVGYPDDIADVVAFLGSTDARYVTGQTIYVDGGLTLATISFFRVAQDG